MDADFLPFIAPCITGDEPSWEAFFSEYGGIAAHILKKRFPAFSLHEIKDIIQNIFTKRARFGSKTKNLESHGRYGEAALCTNRPWR
jgi:hypothetical protein